MRESILDITQDQLTDTFETNVYGFFYVIQEALPFIPEGGAIINTTSITAYQGDDRLIDYSATKGAIVSLTRSLAKSLVSRKIRVNAVAPGPVWTPLQPASFPADALETFGSFTSETPMGRAGQPFEMAQGYVYLACDDSAFMTGPSATHRRRLLWLFLKRTHLCAQRREIRGRRGLYRHLFTGNGMIKPGECTVQRLPSNSAISCTIHCISHKRRAERCKMNTYLMRAPGFQAQAHERHCISLHDRRPMGHRRQSTLSNRTAGMHRVRPDDRPVDRSAAPV